ncbi:Caleosin-domain-containing protein [Pluteus cervinus]|uniref:Caleosin-domain-containing protein n=1 Tax=Pluteus cervinus TaxID=181527 RepID=A0ACD3B287_9AGAR|nr:Caleosin-domain-containing protein [Pluteus cervinus]
MSVPFDGPGTAPDGSSKPGKATTALQSHVGFFDHDGDGIIWPSDTFWGFRELKFNAFISMLAMFIIHTGFSYATWGSWIPDPFFRLKINHMHRGKHGSDSEVYTSTGEFSKDRFEYIFKMYSAPPHESMSFNEGVRMLQGNRNVNDPFGWFAAVFEWLATYLLIWPEDSRMKKQDVRGVYDGTLFYKISGRKMD